MRTLVCTQPGELALVEREKPTIAPGEVLVRIRRVAVCGTDYHIFEGSHPFLEYPRVMGHELSGEIVEVGDGSALTVGQTVYVLPYLSCGKCVACRRGKGNCCQNIKVLGVHIDGGLAEYLALPESAVVPVDGISLDQAAMVEFLAIGAHAVRRAQPQAGDRVLVVGAGPIGIGVMLFAKLRGATVTVLDVREDRLNFAVKSLGATAAVKVGPDAAKELAALTDGDNFDIVFDATGNAKSMHAALDYVAHGGTLVFVSVVRDTISFSDPEFHKRETSLLGSRNATPEDFAFVFQAMKDGLIPTAALNTHRTTLDQVIAIFPTWMKPDAGVIKAIIEV